MKILRWILVNSSIMICFLYGVNYNENILNMAVFLLWVLAILSFVFFWKQVAISKFQKEPNFKPSVPRWIDILYDCCLVLILAYYAYFVLAIFYIIHIFACEIYFNNIKELQEK